MVNNANIAIRSAKSRKIIDTIVGSVGVLFMWSVYISKYEISVNMVLKTKK